MKRIGDECRVLRGSLDESKTQARRASETAQRLESQKSDNNSSNNELRQRIGVLEKANSEYAQQLVRGSSSFRPLAGAFLFLNPTCYTSTRVWLTAGR